MQYRREQYEKNRPNRVYSKPCKYVNYDADGDFCELSVGYGVNSHCWANRGKECPKYEVDK